MLNNHIAETRKSIKGAFPSLTIGSGAAAVLLARSDICDGHKLLSGVSRTASEYHHLCRGDVTGDGLNMHTDAEALLFAGLDVAKTTWAQAELTADKTITHQVGKAHTRALYDALDLDPSTGYLTYDRLGNVGSVSLPITLSMAADDGFIQDGDHVALLGIGSGLSCLMMGVAW